MEQAKIVIIGAGPAGLVLALSLEQQGVASIVLERETEITQDPRGVYLAGDAIRILWSLGFGPQMPRIGHDVPTVNFHTSSFANDPFHTMDVTRDVLQQAVPTGMLMIQPELERALRDRVNASNLCDLRTGCDVQRLQENDDGVEIEYMTPNGSSEYLQATWLIGADGKKGVVRKTFLEKVAAIRQVDSDYKYEGTWIAANLKISLPTLETHPDFPAWKLGMTPEEVYDLFWPKGWHFCSPPGKPTASGRFGPYESRLWRHEFRQDEWDEDSMDAAELFWEHLEPMISRKADSNGRRFETTAVYPRDCIEILRCRPFTFSHKVVNRWFYRRNVLIGDAAHVFPPFGGQGIASGIRDAHQLAWRVALLEKQPQQPDIKVEKILEAWAAERTQSIKDAAHFTKMNGMICNNRKPLMFPLLQAMDWLTQNFPGLNVSADPQKTTEARGFQGVKGGFFLPDRGGGRRIPQIYVDTPSKNEVLSDTALGECRTPLRLLVFGHAKEDLEPSMAEIRKAMCDSAVLKDVLSPDSIITMSKVTGHLESADSSEAKKVRPTSLEHLGTTDARQGYDAAAFEARLGKGTQYAILRPDFYVFATARDLGELRDCLQGLKHMTGGSDNT